MFTDFRMTQTYVSEGGDALSTGSVGMNETELIEWLEIEPRHQEIYEDIKISGHHIETVDCGDIKCVITYVWLLHPKQMNHIYAF